MRPRRAGRRGGQVRVLGENAVFQLAQRRPGVDAEFFGQPGAGAAQRGERVALPPGLV